MASINLIDADGIERWADRATTPALLPKLVRMLIHTTVGHSDIEDIDFRAGRGIYFPGWDGKTEINAGTRYVPEGLARWEVSTEKNPASKARKITKSRTKDPLDADPAKTTYVFITPRHWSGKDEWAKKVKKTDKWMDVKAYDADDLETWMEMSPAVHIWLSTLTGECPGALEMIATNWKHWSEETTPHITASFMLAGRDGVSQSLHQWLQEDMPQISLFGDTKEEVLACFGAFVSQLPEKESEALFDKSLIAKNVEAWNHLCTAEKPLIIIPMFAGLDSIAGAVSEGHKVLLPLDNSDSSYGMVVKIPRLSLPDAEEVLRAEGVSLDRARKLARLARRSMTSYRRQLSTTPEIMQPLWARPENAQGLIPALLIGKWKEDNEGDRQIIEKLGQATYEDVSRPFTRWSSEADPPLRRIGATWYLVSREDSWTLLSRYLNRDNMDLFTEVALEVLGTPDPAYDLPDDEQWRAVIHGKRAKYSDQICQGLAETLALMGARGESTPLSFGQNASVYAAQIVRQLMDRVNTDWHLGASISSMFPLLAEAAPDEFLSKLNKGLEMEHPELLKLFRDKDWSFTSRTPHTGLLWALETLCWSPDYLAQAALLLAKLAKLDPGGRLINRPANSLREVFLPWLPQTSAPWDQRYKVLGIIRQREPEVAWRLFINLLPSSYDSASPTSKPRWREWAPDSDPAVTYGEIDNATKDILTLLLADVGESGSRWKDLIKKIDGLRSDHFYLVADQLAQIDQSCMSSSDRDEIWHALRKLISRHRSFPDADWSLPKERVDYLASLLHGFESPDPLEQFGWLFNNAPEFPEGDFSDWKHREQELEMRQLHAVVEIFHQKGLAGIVDFAGQVERPWLLGIVLGKSDLVIEDEDQSMLEHLSFERIPTTELASGFVKGRILKNGREWAEVKYARGPTWSLEQKVVLLNCMPIDNKTWEMAEQAGSEIEKLYWEKTFEVYTPQPEDIEKAVNKLLEYDLPWAAMMLLGHRLHIQGDLEPSLIIRTLKSMIDIPPGSNMHVDAYLIAKLLDYLYDSKDVEEQEVTEFEWAFLPLLRYERKPKVLHDRMAKDPNFFVEVVSIVYLAEGEEKVQASDEEKHKAERGYKLLQGWQVVPGTTPDGAIDYDQLKQWVEQARKALEACGRKGIGDDIIGTVLNFSPEDADGTWPHKSVRRIIEEYANEEIKEGFRVGVYNKRGVTTRSPYDGGEQERQLASKYDGYAEKVRDEFPTTTTLLRKIAKHYKAEAEREDQRRDLRQDIY